MTTIAAVTQTALKHRLIELSASAFTFFSLCKVNPLHIFRSTTLKTTIVSVTSAAVHQSQRSCATVPMNSRKLTPGTLWAGPVRLRALLMNYYASLKSIESTRWIILNHILLMYSLNRKTLLCVAICRVIQGDFYESPAWRGSSVFQASEGQKNFDYSNEVLTV